MALAAEQSRTVVLAGRDITGLARAAQRIQSSTGNGNVVPMLVDLAALSSVRMFVADFCARDLPPLSTIICNAGISTPTPRRRSADGFELTFATNHLSHFLMVNLLLDHLRPPARILFVSSDAHNVEGKKGPMQPARYVRAEWLAYPERDPDLPQCDAAAGGQAYATSKLCNILCAYELARRLREGGLLSADRSITSNAYAPGLIAGTGLGRDATGWTRFAWYYVMPIMSRVMGFGRTPKAAGADLAYLASAPELGDVSGQYFRGREPSRSSAASYNRDFAADLWHTSVRLCSLRPDESTLVSASGRAE
jgi:NAD(P)-dependent dehydrogenase (short-subunit alcohol dehydrogenase family)